MYGLIVCSIPGSFINSYIDYLNKRLAIEFRRRLTLELHEKYLKNLVFY